jgi:hypothetical protein
MAGITSGVEGHLVRASMYTWVAATRALILHAWRCLFLPSASAIRGQHAQDKEDCAVAGR